jgi:RimJ/RimL family protein N-acetyltransferase
MNLVVREAELSDAEPLVAHVRRLLEEPGIDLAMSPGEFDVSAEKEREILLRYATSENSIYLVAEVDGEIVGTAVCTGGKRRATRHVTTLGGMAVAKGWRNQGIGNQLMERAMAWARETEIVKRVELSVFARNEIALHLYRSFGFVVEGRRRAAIHRDGQYLDDLMMGRLLFDGDVRARGPAGSENSESQDPPPDRRGRFNDEEE